MVRCLRFSPLLVLAGCLPLEVFDVTADQTRPMPINPFGNSQSAAQTVKTNYAVGSQELTVRVDFAGRKILAANKDINLSPLFATVGSPQPEIFHRRTESFAPAGSADRQSDVIYLTDGLVKQCKTEAELAALLCLELGKMVSEREALAPVQARNFDNRPPISVPIGNAGQFTASDNVALAELAKYDREHPKRRLPPPDPRRLAEGYLEKAGFKAADLDAVAPLLAAAERNYNVEKQFKDNAPSGWAPAN